MRSCSNVGFPDHPRLTTGLHRFASARLGWPRHSVFVQALARSFVSLLAVAPLAPDESLTADPFPAAPDRPQPALFSGRRLLLLLPALVVLKAGLETLQGTVGLHLRGPENLAMIAYSESLPWSTQFGLLLTGSFPLLVVLPLAFLLSRRYPLGGRQTLRNALIHLLLATVAAPVVHVAIASSLRYWLFIRPYGIGAAFSTVFTRYLTLFYLGEVATYGALVVLYHAWHYYRRAQERELDAARLRQHAAELKSTLGQAQLDALRAQLQPHYLFNSLNSVAVLARQGRPDDVAAMIRHLTRLLRGSLRARLHQQSLREELSLVRHYVAVEQVRFGARLSVRCRIRRECGSCQVPVLLLQPLVENAVRHGIARVPGPGFIEIRAWTRHDLLRITVSNSGLNAPARVRSGGIGLANTRARLRQLYGPAFRLRLLSRRAGGTVVFLELPRVEAGAASGQHQFEGEAS